MNDWQQTVACVTLVMAFFVMRVCENRSERLPFVQQWRRPLTEEGLQWNENSPSLELRDDVPRSSPPQPMGYHWVAGRRTYIDGVTYIRGHWEEDVE